MRNILNVATYESKTLFRSWFFRIFSILALLILFGTNMGMFASDDSRWTFRAIPANLPYINILFINVAEAIIAVFLASDFLRRDKKLDTTEVIYTRPVTNGEYVLGKTLGILGLFLGLALVAMCMSLIFNLVIKDMPVVWKAYLLYPLLISVPTMVYILGLSFFMMILFRSQAITFLILLAYIGVTLFYFQDKAYGLLDYMAFNLPMVRSDIIQFAEPGKILMHRLTYLFLGFGFIFATIRFLNRLPQTGRWNSLNILGFVIFIAAGGIMGTRYILAAHQETLQRDIYLDLNERYAMSSVVDLLSCDLELVKQGRQLQISSDIRFRNSNARSIDTMIFSLNPGFVIDSILDGKGHMEYFREGQILHVIPSLPIQEGRRGSISMYYRGIPDAAVANLDISKEALAASKRITVAPLDKKAGIVDENFMLLTPGMLWYPVAGVGFNRLTFLSCGLDFTRFSLVVRPDRDLVALAPGKSSFEEGTYRFRPAHDLSAFPLIIGSFKKQSMELDGVLYSLYFKPDHDYFSESFTNISDTIPALITEAKNDYELDELDLYLEFDQISLVEVPIQYHAFEHPYSQLTDYVFPEMILIPEKGAGLSTLDFKRYAKMTENRDRKNDNIRSPRELEVEMFKRLLQNTFFQSSARANRRGVQQADFEPLINFGGESDYSVNPFCAFPLYYNLVTGISSKEYPVFNSMLEIYLKEGFEVSPRQGFTGGITDNEKANLALMKHSLNDIFAQGNSELTSSLINQTGSFIISALKNRVGLANFDNFFYYYLEDHAFQEIPYKEFEADFREEFGVEISPYMDIISSAGKMAAFLVSDPEYIQTRDDLGDVYLVRFRISNTGNASGMVDVTFRIMGQGGFGGGGGMSTEQRLFEVEAGVTHEVQVVLYEQPRMMTVNTLISGNIPSSFNHFLRSPAEKSETMLEEYDRISDKAVTLRFENEYVVDNEDEGFTSVAVSRESKLKQYIDSRKQSADEVSYGSLSRYLRPSKWHPVAHSSFYGEEVRTAMASRKGDGSNVARWATKLPEAGFYEVYVYIPVSAMYRRPQGRPEGGGGQNQQGGQGSERRGPEFEDEGTDYHYILSSNEGREELEFILNTPEDGWNRLGSFHFPSDSVSITLSNQTGGDRVIADAVKWVWRPN